MGQPYSSLEYTFVCKDSASPAWYNLCKALKATMTRSIAGNELDMRMKSLLQESPSSTQN